MITREALKAQGYTDEQIDGLLDMFHSEEQELRGQVTKLTSERDEAKTEAAKYQKGGEYYTDPKEIERLKEFETSTKAEKVKATKDKAFEAMLAKLKVKDDYKKLLKKSLNYDELEVTDKGEIAEIYEKKFAEELKADCPSAFDMPPVGTGIGFGNAYGGEKSKDAEPTNNEWTAAIGAKQNSK